jgi:hypothetical protein
LDFLQTAANGAQTLALPTEVQVHGAEVEVEVGAAVLYPVIPLLLNAKTMELYWRRNSRKLR